MVIRQQQSISTQQVVWSVIIERIVRSGTFQQLDTSESCVLPDLLCSELLSQLRSFHASGDTRFLT